MVNKPIEVKAQPKVAQPKLGEQVQSNDYIFQRQQICNACDRKNPFNSTCMECGCPILELNRNVARRCPIGKW